MTSQNPMSLVKNAAAQALLNEFAHLLNETPVKQVPREPEDRQSPLVDRLRRLLAQYPPEVLRAGISLDELRSRLRGRWRGNAHAADVGAALRKLGFTRTRGWREGDEGFRAKWYPARLETDDES